MTNKISILGPEYSYCHILAMRAFPNRGFILCNTIGEIYKNVSEGITEEGIAPIENMIHGSVRESLTALQKYKVKINKSYDLPIHHCLASQSDNYNKVISHSQALGQCTKFIFQQKDKKTEESSSTSQAMQIASQNSDYAAIGSKEAALHYGLRILKENIEDNHDNITRFILISKQDNKEESKNSRTSLMIVPHKDKPGLLSDILKTFKDRNINLTKIESIPTGKKLGEYQFFIEIEGNVKNKEVFNSIEEIKKFNGVYVFGSYEIEKINYLS